LLATIFVKLYEVGLEWIWPKAKGINKRKPQMAVISNPRGGRNYDRYVVKGR
jgi:hypothetical protein